MVINPDLEDFFFSYINWNDLILGLIKCRVTGWLGDFNFALKGHFLNWRGLNNLLKTPLTKTLNYTDKNHKYNKNNHEKHSRTRKIRPRIDLLAKVALIDHQITTKHHPLPNYW